MTPTKVIRASACIAAALTIAAGLSHAMPVRGGMFVPQALLDRARAEGKVRIMVHLRPAPPLSAVGPGAAARPESVWIKQKQDAVIAALIGEKVKVTARFKVIPYLGLEVDYNALKKLETLERPLQIVVQEDRLFRPASSNLPQIGAPESWTAGYTGSEWAIVIIDTGVDVQHKELVEKVAAEACFSAPDADGKCVCPGQTCDSAVGPGTGGPCSYGPASGCAHGTNVAGIAAGRETGVARGARIAAIQVYGRRNVVKNGLPAIDLLAYETDILRALEHVDVDLKAQLKIAAVNMSLGGALHTTEQACEIANSAFADIFSVLGDDGISVVVASGNDGSPNAVSAPACLRDAISVGSVNSDDMVYSTSNSASFLKLLAPGGSIWTAAPGGRYGAASGTSMAAPHVAGAIAILRHKKPTDTPAQMLAQLQGTGIEVTDGKSGVKTKRLCIAKAAAGKDCPAP